jgi:hypothetical protein
MEFFSKYKAAALADVAPGACVVLPSRRAAALLTLPEVAGRLHKSVRWLQGWLKDHPFGRMAGRTRLFTEGDVAAIIEALPCPSSSSSVTAPRSGTSAAPSEDSLWTQAQSLLTAGRRKRSGRNANGRSSRGSSAEIAPLRRF